MSPRDDRHPDELISALFDGELAPEEWTEVKEHLERCREVFPDKPISLGCYLRDYPTQAPMPMDAVRHQWTVLVKALATDLVNGYDILGTVLIDGQLEQATWVRDFIRDHS